MGNIKTDSKKLLICCAAPEKIRNENHQFYFSKSNFSKTTADNDGVT